MEIYKSTYQTLNIKGDSLVNVWYPGMDEDTFKTEMQVFAEKVMRYRAKNILVDLSQSDFIVTPDLQDWSEKLLSDVYEKAGTVKQAIVVSADIMALVSVKQSVEDNASAGITEYFPSIEEAEEWIISN
ncbi:hypothetical protein [Algivirga pacifica]|uniref:STAS/SEC14 domain-containing protein n=1 Tax=Algivirga pacifica TaxID=1162670 RepID=A0ABP9DEJ0_9BACT